MAASLNATRLAQVHQATLARTHEASGASEMMQREVRNGPRSSRKVYCALN